MYRTKPCLDCGNLPAPEAELSVLILNASLKNDAAKHMAKNLARNLMYYAQLLKKYPMELK